MPQWLWTLMLLASLSVLVDGIRRLWTYPDEGLLLRGFPLAALELYGVFLPSAVWSTLKLESLCPQFAWKLLLIITMAILVLGTIFYTIRQRTVAAQECCAK